VRVGLLNIPSRDTTARFRLEEVAAMQTEHAPQTQHAPSAQTSGRAGFLAQREARWNELELLCNKAKGKVSRLSPGELRTLGNRYRETSADLAIARQQFPNDPMLYRLESVVAPARALVYDRPPRSFSVWNFLSTRYWQRILERKWLLLGAVVLLMGPALIMYFWTIKDPARAQTLFPSLSNFRSSYDDAGMSASQQSAFSSQIFTNNIRVSFLAFAGGITFGLATAYLLVFNGAMLGFVVGMAVTKGQGDVVTALIAGHGVLELSVIAVSAMAGMRMGVALIKPGLRTRGQALRREAVAAVEIVVGTIPWFVLAGLIEGFFTPAGFGPTAALIVGVAVGAVYWVLVFWRGRTRTRT
jgi:uncharacterized membrane protein SpoIIM required for sporulation